MKTRKYSRFSTDEQSSLDLQNIIDSMLNPDAGELFHIMTDNKEQEIPDTHACECMFLHCFLSHDHAVTKTQKIILDAFGIDVPLVKYRASEISKELADGITC